MRVIAIKRLREYWQNEPATEQALRASYAEAEDADWKTPAEIKAKYGNASVLKNGRVVFNICGNNYRLVVAINYDYATVYVRFIGTHKEYDKIDANTT
jgi:mRNA interferase HigB